MQKEPNLTAKVALITGAARRIGAEISRCLHQAGMNIVVHYQTSRAEAEALCGNLNALRENSAIALQADLIEIEKLPDLVDQAALAWGRLDVLVNNASRFYKTSLGQTPEAAWDDLMNTNLKAPFFLSQAAYPYLKKQQGCIINIADIHAERPMREYPVYSITKAGLIMLTKALAKELGPEVRVNAVSPGAIAWPEGKNDLSAALKEQIIQRTALLCHGDPSDIAKAVLYFVRDADYVTGQVIAVDGGRNLST
ncbi:MAG: pteridine reductase [Gammaproteobacteria bacterium]